MRKTLVIILGMLILPIGLLAADRVVVLEIVTATRCPACPAAAHGAEDLADAHPGEVLILEYHNADGFDNKAGDYRTFNVYSVQYLPTAFFDGEYFGGSSVADQYESKFQERKGVDSPLEIELVRITDAYSSTSGTLRAVISNPSGENVSGTVNFSISESDIPFQWQTEEYLHWVERDMLPYQGESISLSPGEELTLDRNFTIDENWFHFTENENIEFGCFVQGEDDEIYQAAVLEYGEPVDIEELPEDVPFTLHTPHLAGYTELALSKASDVELTLYDALGRYISNLYCGNLPAGNHRISIPTDELSTGTYFIRAACGSKIHIAKLLIIR
ncbi:hypothetical protein JXM67_09545 [candidate division WOR-3 bacterium]|nr:hypothetical protein [candidate division WOR-3 bacterium]